ncbi:MAG: redoxin domain-containing protein [Agriterribacter sp.]
MKKICLLGMLCLSLTAASAQVKPVNIGEALPPLTLKNAINTPVFEIQSSSFSGKLVILDFWATWCAACVTEFPKLQALKDRFGEQLEIILVNAKSRLAGETPAKIQKTLERFKSRTGSPLSLPVVYDNPHLDSLFPYTTIPHEVWIHNGKVIAITSSLELNAANIAAVLNNQPYQMRTKIDHGALAARKAAATPSLPENALFRATLTGFREGYYGTGTYPDSTDSRRIRGLYYYNNTLEELLREACTHNRLFDVPPNRVVFEVADPRPFRKYSDTAIYRYQYCYELRLPPTDFPAARAWMFGDLCRFFKLKVDTPMRALPCLVVRGAERLSRSKSRGGEPTLDIDLGTVRKFLRHYTVPRALALLDRYCDIPIIDETDSPLVIDLDLPEDITDPVLIKNALEKAGFAVSREMRALKVTLVSDR